VFFLIYRWFGWCKNLEIVFNIWWSCERVNVRGLHFYGPPARCGRSRQRLMTVNVLMNIYEVFPTADAQYDCYSGWRFPAPVPCVLLLLLLLAGGTGANAYSFQRRHHANFTSCQWLVVGVITKPCVVIILGDLANRLSFRSRHAIAWAGSATVCCLSVCPSVRLVWRWWIVIIWAGLPGILLHN